MSITNPSADLPTKFGNFTILVWPSEDGKDSVALVTPKLDVSKPVLVRVHSECLTGDVFGSYRCDCGMQLQKSMTKIAKSKNGVFIYLKQEGRGIGLAEKVRTMALQEQGYDTHEANILLGHAPDPREYSMVKVILGELGVKEIKLMTNNPSKEKALRSYGFKISERIPLIVRSNKYNKAYIKTKKIKFKHFDGGNNLYYYGVTRVTDKSQIESIAQCVSKYRNYPSLRIGIGFSATNAILNDQEKINNLASLYAFTDTFGPLLVPIFHYSFKNSKPKMYKNELELIHKKMPFIKRILLNDLEKEHLELISLASKFFAVHFPVNDNVLHVISDPKYARLAKAKKLITVLDNSGGRGIPENIASFEKKISLCLNNGINDIALAGGFGPNKLETFFKLEKYFKINFSIDAESMLMKDDKLDISLVTKYFEELLESQLRK